MKWNLKNKRCLIKVIHLGKTILNLTSRDIQKSSQMDHRPQYERQIVKLLEDNI